MKRMNKEYFSYQIQKIKTALYLPIKPTQFYPLGLIVGLISMFSIILTSGISFVSTFYLWGSVFLFVTGFCWELFSYLQRLYKESRIATSIAVGISGGVVTSTLAVVVAEQLINSATHLNPQYFDNSLILITAFCIPFVLLNIISIVLFFCYVITIVVSLPMSIYDSIKFIFMKGEKGFGDGLIMARALSAAMLSILITTASNKITGEYNDEVIKIVKFTVVLADHYQFGPCLNVRYDERFAFLDKNRISVVSQKNDITFEVRKCNRERILP